MCRDAVVQFQKNCTWFPLEILSSFGNIATLEFSCNALSPTNFHCPTLVLRQIKGIRCSEGWLGGTREHDGRVGALHVVCLLFQLLTQDSE